MKYSKVEIDSLVVHKQNLLLIVTNGGGFSSVLKY